MGTHTIGPPTTQITIKNKIAKGMSIKVVMVAEVMKSRKDSNSRKVFAIEPTGPLRAAISISTTCSKSVSAIIMSACAPAVSRK